MISGNLRATEEFYGQRIGADDFMKKPFGRTEVFTRIQHLVEKERLPPRAIASVVGDAIGQHDPDAPGQMIHDAADDVDPPLPHEAPPFTDALPAAAVQDPDDLRR
jgi:twitching motility two-component system response regulator PilH